MIVNVECRFKCDFDTVKKYLSLSETLAYINEPLISFEAIDQPHPKVWTPGHHQALMKVFNIPFGRQTINIEFIEGMASSEYIIRDNGFGDIISVWDHWILVKQTKHKDEVIYIDRIDVKAGLLTPFVAIFAHVLYRHRQRRWRLLIKKNFRPIENGMIQ